MEVSRTPMNLRFYAGEALRTAGSHPPQPATAACVFTLRAPVGVVAAITPWNFPLNIPSRKLGPALAAGNGVVFKPSEVTPLIGQRLVEALLEGGLPAGALAVLSRRRRGRRRGRHRRAASTPSRSPAPPQSARRSTRGRRAPASAPSSRWAARTPSSSWRTPTSTGPPTLIAKGAFGLSGQACTGTSRVIVHDAVHDALVERIVEGAGRCGSAPASSRGGMGRRPPNASSRSSSATWQIGRRRRTLATVCGDEQVPRPGARLFVRPDGLHRRRPGSGWPPRRCSARCSPSCGCTRSTRPSQVADATRFGLSAGIVTSDIGRAMTFARGVEVRPREDQPADHRQGHERTLRRNQGQQHADVEGTGGRLDDGLLHGRQDRLLSAHGGNRDRVPRVATGSSRAAPSARSSASAASGQVPDGYVRRFYAETEHGQMELRWPGWTARPTPRPTTAPTWTACSAPASCRTTASAAPATTACSTWRPARRSSRRPPSRSAPTRCARRTARCWSDCPTATCWRVVPAAPAAAGMTDGGATGSRWGPVRTSTLATGGMVSSSSPAVSQVGARVLADGGTAVDAALAMTAMSWLALPGQCGIGGDAFAVVREPDGRVWTVNGSGYGPDGASAEATSSAACDRCPADRAAGRRRAGRAGALATLHAAGRHPRRSPSCGRPAAARRPHRRAVHGEEPRRHRRARRRARPRRRTCPGGCCPTAAFPPVGDRLPSAGPRRPASRCWRAGPQALYTRRVRASAPSRCCAPAVRSSPATSGSRRGRARGGRDQRALRRRHRPPDAAAVARLDAAAAGRRCSTGSSPASRRRGAESVHLLARPPAGPSGTGTERCASDNDAWRDLLDAELARAAPELGGEPAVAGPLPDRRRHDQLRRRGRRRPRGQRDLLAGLHVRRPDLDPGHRHRAEQPAGPRRLPAARAPQRR